MSRSVSLCVRQLIPKLAHSRSTRHGTCSRHCHVTNIEVSYSVVVKHLNGHDLIRPENITLLPNREPVRCVTCKYSIASAIIDYIPNERFEAALRSHNRTYNNVQRRIQQNYPRRYNRRTPAQMLLTPTSTQARAFP
jgi:hypothetical protein